MFKGHIACGDQEMVSRENTAKVKSNQIIEVLEYKIKRMLFISYRCHFNM